jgi:hypothetical protein
MNNPPSKGGRSYERVRRLGTDGPFVVEVAWPKRAGGVQQAVLLKRLRPGWPVVSQALKQFLEDARYVSRLAHGNIVRVLDIAKDKQGPVLVTEHIHGVSLAAVLREVRGKDLSFTLAQVLSVARQVCSGLKAAQTAGPEGRGIIHGAVSPEHLMITFEGVVKLKDFGIFRMYPANQRDSLGGPNPVYLSVEQEQGLQPGIRSDLFALGRVLQKLLSLCGDQHLPGEITGVLSRLLENDPAKRPPSAAALEPELEALVLTHGSGHQKARLQLGDFVRGLFKTETPASKAAASEEASVSQDLSLLDPAAFWDGGEGETAPGLEEEDTAEAEVIAGAETTGEAVVVSAPAGRPKEMFLPESERIVVTPKQPERPAASSAPPVPQKDFLKVGRTKNTNMTVGGVAAAVLVILLGVVWLITSDGDETAPDASVAGPVTGGGEPSRPGEPRETGDAGGDEQAAPPADGETGVIKLTSIPPGALVYVNDDKKGVTPLTVRDAVLGTEVKIRVELEGHKPWTQTVTLDENNKVLEFEAGLLEEEVCEFGTGWIYVTSEPAGGTVEMDGRRLPGKTPMIINDVCAGVEHEIRVQATGYPFWRKMVFVRSGKVVNLNVELQR